MRLKCGNQNNTYEFKLDGLAKKEKIEDIFGIDVGAKHLDSFDYLFNIVGIGWGWVDYQLLLVETKLGL